MNKFKCNNCLMKRRLTYQGKRVYIKTLSSNYALVSFSKDKLSKLFKVDRKELAAL